MHRRPATVVVLSLLVAGPAAAQFETTEVSGLTAGAPLYLTKTAWSWQDQRPAIPEITYNVYRRLPADEFRCIASNLTAPGWPGDPTGPAPGELYLYTVNGDDAWGENLHGSTIPVVERCLCSGPAPVSGTTLVINNIASGFTNPMHVTHVPGEQARLFVVEQAGVIKIIKRGVVLPTPFLSIGTIVVAGGERGLLSLAFHPDYATNGLFYVFYTATGGGANTIAEYQVSADPDIADPASGRVLLAVPDFASNHNGGQLAFGPFDGYLYAGFGDGGGTGDPDENGENFAVLLGKILRIDVDTRTLPLAYGIPPSNPFVGTPPAREEIWAYGLRNPWRFSFDTVTGDLYIGDVGQGAREEVDVQPAASRGGEHYGWNMYEGTNCFDVPCSPTGITFPIVEYTHSAPTVGNSITGGHVYRGCRSPDLAGYYFYADYGSGYAASFQYVGGVEINRRIWTSTFGLDRNAATSFGIDSRGEVYIVTRTTTYGRVGRIQAN